MENQLLQENTDALLLETGDLFIQDLTIPRSVKSIMGVSLEAS